MCKDVSMFQAANQLVVGIFTVMTHNKIKKHKLILVDGYICLERDHSNRMLLERLVLDKTNTTRWYMS